MVAFGDNDVGAVLSKKVSSILDDSVDVVVYFMLWSYSPFVASRVVASLHKVEEVTKDGHHRIVFLRPLKVPYKSLTVTLSAIKVYVTDS